MKILSLFLLFFITACSGYKTPTFNNPSKMSADTLCYRYAYAKNDPAIRNEVEARNLDCETILQDMVPRE